MHNRRICLGAHSTMAAANLGAAARRIAMLGERGLYPYSVFRVWTR